MFFFIYYDNNIHFFIGFVQDTYSGNHVVGMMNYIAVQKTSNMLVHIGFQGIRVYHVI